MVLIDGLVFLIYRWFAFPLALGILRFSQYFLPAKIQEMLLDRSMLNLQLLPARPIWIHAASGEIEYAKSVIRSLKSEFPQVPILVTYFSPSAKKLIQKFPGIDLAMALPWDRPADLKKFLDFYQPRVCLIARTDVWPEMARALKKRRIPSLLFAATLASGSSRRGFFSGPLNRGAMNSLTSISCVSEEDLANFRAIGVRTSIQISGDTRFDQVIHRLKHPQPIKENLRPSSSDRIFICGSTWPEDELVLFDTWTHWLQKGGKIILAPHELNPRKLSELEEKFTRFGWTFSRYSQANSWESQILLIDQIGILQELYLWGNLAFVGGSFKGKVHSVMEPLCVGLPVCVGPFHSNNREALLFQFVKLDTNLFAVNSVKNSTDIIQVMDQVWELPKPHPALLEKIKKSSGATQRVIDWVTEQEGSHWSR